MTNETLIEQIGRVVGEVAPSMLLSSLSMSSCFFIGSLTEMPAVQKFALYAGVALVINFFLQMTAFLAIFTLDTQRMEEGRLDIFCCIRAKSAKKGGHHEDDSSNIRSDMIGSKEGLLYTFFRDIYTPFLMKDSTRISVLIIFSFWLCSSIAVLDQIHVGLEQDITMPEDSYMTKYFDHYQKYFEVGPPVYFMISEGYNYSDISFQNKICGLYECDVDSLSQILSYHAVNNSQKYVFNSLIFLHSFYDPLFLSPSRYTYPF